MQRVPHKGSSQQSLIILVLIILIIIAVSVNLILAWFYSRAINSRIEIIGNVNIAYQILNGKTMKLEADELVPGNIVKRSVQIQKDSYASNFYLRFRVEVRIDGVPTSSIGIRIAEESAPFWQAENVMSGQWFYCYSDYLTWYDEMRDITNNRSPFFSVEYVIPQSMSTERLSHVFTNIVHIEVVSIYDNISHWQNLPVGWPYVAQEE